MNFQDSFEHQVLPVPFTVLTLCGTWYPENWSARKKRFYNFFTAAILVLGISLFIEMLLNVILTIDTDKFTLEDIFATIVFAVGIYKKTNILLYRRNIINLITKYTNNPWHKPRNVMEALITLRNRIETKLVQIIIYYLLK